MLTDYLFILGLAVALVSVPSMIAAYADQRAPRLSAAAFVLALSAMLFAYVEHPGGYRFSEVPDLLVAVIADILK
ncbi:hypothetical protein [Shimia sp.]|uniref:hypothetical protein n=1 Tax=Shimia sp. TaxID=1954381 RepID=UPI003565CABE